MIPLSQNAGRVLPLGFYLSGQQQEDWRLILSLSLLNNAGCLERINSREMNESDTEIGFLGGKFF